MLLGHEQRGQVAIHSLAPPAEIVRRGEGVGGKFDTDTLFDSSFCFGDFMSH